MDLYSKFCQWIYYINIFENLSLNLVMFLLNFSKNGSKTFIVFHEFGCQIVTQSWLKLSFRNDEYVLKINIL